MESCQPEMLPNSNLSVLSVSVSPKPNSIAQNPSTESGFNGKKTPLKEQDGAVGVLEVCIHQARDIHNICIYQKQDVYAKICLTSDPETAVSTQIINGGGKNPVFNETFRLNVKSLESSLKCEIWMLSRVRNYLQDQLLGFSLVPLSDVVAGNGKLAQEFSLSSSDLFHSPAGFVQLTLAYTGASPEVLEIPTPRSSASGNLTGNDSEAPISVPNDLDRIEFPDPQIVNENEMMVSEYFGIPCADLDSTSTENLDSTGDDANAPIKEVPKVETPPTSVSTTASPSASIVASSDTAVASKPLNQDNASSPKEKTEDSGEADSCSTRLPLINVKIETGQKVVQQEIVDMYMKSMQQFTESLAKMKLPLDIEKEPAGSKDDEKAEASKNNGRSPRVFYGSRAFF